MKTLIILLLTVLFFFDINAQQLQTSYDAIPKKNIAQVFKDSFSFKSTRWNISKRGKAKVRNGKLTLKRNAINFAKFSLNNDRNFEISFDISYVKGSKGYGAGVLFGGNAKSKNWTIFWLDGQRLGAGYWYTKSYYRGYYRSSYNRSVRKYQDLKITQKTSYKKKSFVNLTIRKLGQYVHYYYNHKWVGISIFKAFGGQVGLFPPKNGIAEFDNFKISYLDDFPSKIKVKSEKYVFGNMSNEVEYTDILKPLKTAVYRVSLQNLGPFDLKNVRFEIKDLSKNPGLDPQILDKFSNLRLGQTGQVSVILTSDKHLKSGIARYEIKLIDQHSDLVYGPFAFKFDTQGYPESKLSTKRLLYKGGGTTNTLRGGSIGTFLLEVTNQGVEAIPEIQVELKSPKNVKLLKSKFKGKILPGYSKTFLLPVILPLKFQQANTLVSFKVEAQGMKAKKIEKNFRSVSFKITPTRRGISQPLTKFYGNPYFNYPQVSSGLSNTSNPKAALWKAIFHYLGDANHYYDLVVASSFADNNIDKVYSKAFQGDLEAVLLMGLAYQYGLGVPKDNQVAVKFLQMAHEAGYPYGTYALARNYYLSEDEVNKEEAKKLFRQAHEKGVNKAMYWIGVMKLEGKGFAQNKQEAYRIFKKLADQGDPRSMYMVGAMHLNGTGVEINAQKASSYLNKSAKAGITDAMILLGTWYTTGKYGKEKNTSLAHKWLSMAANRGDLNAIFTYGAFQLNPEYLGPSYTNAHKYLLKAAKRGHSGAMALLGKMYYKGLRTPINKVKARFWTNEASNQGENVKNETPVFENYAMKILYNIDWNSAIFGKTVTGINRFGNPVNINTGSNMIGQVLGSTIGMWMNSRIPDPNSINRYDFIMEKKGQKIYAATVNGFRPTKIMIRKGQVIKFKVSGRVQVGMFAGVTDPRGIGGFRRYNISRKFRHGSFIARVGNGDWELIGNTAFIIADRDGLLDIALNDSDNSNNKGGFDVKITVID